MKNCFSKLILALGIFLVTPFAFSDATYYYQNPTYIPSAVSPSANFTAPTTYVVTLQNIAVLAFEVNGTCTSLAATAQITVDGTTWRTVNVFPYTSGTITAAASISAAGAYRVSTAGALKARLNVTALTASCNIAAVGTSSGSVDK